MVLLLVNRAVPKVFALGNVAHILRDMTYCVFACFEWLK